MSYRGDKEFLQDILNAIEQLNKYSDRSFAEFQENELVRVWILYHVQIVGEAAARLSERLRHEHPAVPWQGIIAMRNVLVHGYFTVNLGRVWDSVQEDLPILQNQIAAILARGEIK